jgi:O-antigen/teichoic acid export membrane protein
VVVVAAAGTWMAVGLLLPDRLGVAVFGKTWHNAEEVMFPMGLAVLAGSVATGAFAGLRSLGDARDSLRARLFSLPVEVVLSLVGVFVAGAVGYAYGYALASALIAAIWWAFFLAALRRHARGAESAADDYDAVAAGAAASWSADASLPQPIPGSSP